MVDKILENYTKAVESTLRLQQEMLRNWTMQWSPLGIPVFELPLTGTSTSASDTPAAAKLEQKPEQLSTAQKLEQLSTAQRTWAEAATDMLKRHQETLDEQYRAGIRAIHDACRVGEARDPEQFRRLSEELWRRNCEVLNAAVASQMHDIQSVMQKAYEAARSGAAGTKV